MKHFNQNFSEFWDRLINSCSREIIYDEYMIDTLISWVQVLASSTYRAFRHTATFVSLQMIDSIISIATKQRSQLELVERQLETSSQSKKNKNTVEKKDVLIENIKALEAMIQSIFNGVVVHRYRDVFPQIRSQSVEAIGRWCLNYPAHFLKNVYTKYLGWTLYDTVSEVRFSALNAIKQIYQQEEYVNQLDLFTQRFSERMVEMRLDKDPHVSVCAISLLENLTCNYEKINDQDVNKVFELIEENDRSIRSATAKFINRYLFDSNNQTTKKSAKKDKKQLVEQNIQELAKFVLEIFESKQSNQSSSSPPSSPSSSSSSSSSSSYELDRKKEETTEIIVDAIWEHAEWLKDWNSLTECLIDEEDNQMQLVYSKIISTSVKRSVGVEVCGKLDNSEKSLSKKQIQANQNEITEHFIKFLPDLFNSFKAESFIGSIVEITNHLLLDHFATQSAENSHHLLISNLSQIFLQNPHQDTLLLIADVWNKILNTSYPLRHQSLLSFHSLAEQISFNFTSVFDRAMVIQFFQFFIFYRFFFFFFFFT